MPQDTVQLKKSLIIDSGLFFTYLFAAAYLFYFLSTARPHVGMWQEILMVIPLFGVFRRGFFIIHTLKYKKQTGHKFIISVACFVASFIITAVFANISSGLAVDKFTQAYQPMINALHANEISACTQVNSELSISEIVRPKVTNRGELNTEYSASIYFSGNNFVVAINSQSYGKSSGTLYYESQRKRWKQFHNDLYNDRRIFEEFIENAIVCTVKESRL